MNAKFIAIVHRVVADYGAPDPRNLGRFNSLLADYALGKYRRERKALMEALQRVGCADIDKAIVSVKMFPVPDPEKIKNAINKGGSNVQRGINAAGTIGTEVVKTGAAVVGNVVKAAGEVVKGGYEAIGGAEGVQRGAEAAGKAAREALKVGSLVIVDAGKAIAGNIKVGYDAIGGAEGVQRGAEAAGKAAKEVMKIGAIVTIEAGKAIADTVKEVSQEVRRSRGGQDNRRLLEDRGNDIEYEVRYDDDD
jgi:hypothetical protein